MIRALCTTALLLVLAPVARADGTANCTLRTIHALPAPGAVDARLGNLKERLTRPPFTEWKTFKLLGQNEARLTPGQAAGFTVIPGLDATLTFKQHLGEQAKHRMRLQLEMRRGGQPYMSTVFVVDEGGTVLTAGTKHEGGILILCLSCSTAG